MVSLLYQELLVNIFSSKLTQTLRVSLLQVTENINLSSQLSLM